MNGYFSISLNRTYLFTKTILINNLTRYYYFSIMLIYRINVKTGHKLNASYKMKVSAFE